MNWRTTLLLQLAAKLSNALPAAPAAGTAPDPNNPSVDLPIHMDTFLGIFFHYVLPAACLMIAAAIIFGHKKRRMADNAETTMHLVWGIIIALGAPAFYALGNAIVSKGFGS